MRKYIFTCRYFPIKQSYLNEKNLHKNGIVLNYSLPILPSPLSSFYSLINTQIYKWCHICNQKGHFQKNAARVSKIPINKMRKNGVFLLHPSPHPPLHGYASYSGSAAVFLYLQLPQTVLRLYIFIVDT